MKFTFLSLAVVLANACLAARPVVETERMLKENAYQGTWFEKHHDEALKVAFATNGWMVLDYRGCPQLFRWKSNGKGLIELAPGEMPEKTVMKLKYLPKQDIMDCGFEGKKTQLDFTGRLAFKSTEVSAEHAEALREATARHERYREERFERLKKSGDPRLICTTNLIERINPNRLLKERAYIETVDLEYPRIQTSQAVCDDLIFIRLYYGAHENRGVKEHEIEVSDWRRILYKLPKETNEIGIPREQALKALVALHKCGIDAELFCSHFGEGEQAWWEEGISCFVHAKDYDDAAAVLLAHFEDARPRYAIVRKVE